MLFYYTHYEDTKYLPNIANIVSPVIISMEPNIPEPSLGTVPYPTPAYTEVGTPLASR
jgi:hypothetical protein